MTYSVSRAVVDRFYQFYTAHDTDGLAPLLHDDIEWTISGPVDVLSFCGVRRGKAAVLDLVDRVVPSVYRVVSFTQDSFLMDGDRVATLNRMSGRRCDDGRIVSYRIAHFMRFKDDKVIANLSLLDTFDAVEQFIGHRIDLGARVGNTEMVAV
jgi:ketosteroid isomerase-like protein